MTVLISALFKAWSNSDVILPPISSKVIKYILEYKGGILAEMSKSKAPYKGFQITPLKVDGKYLISKSEKPMVLKKNVEAYFRIGIALNDLMYEIFDNIQGTHETIYGKFNIELHSIKVTSLSNLSIRLNNSIILKFKTPTLLSSKYMLPPIYKNKKIKEMSRLIPQPSLIISFLVRLWNSIAQPKELIVKGDSEWTPYMIGRIADVVFTEVSYNVRPVTAIIGKDNKDRLRKVRGFEGWVKYEVLRMKKYHEIFEKLLGLSEFLGVGRSRGIGFGVAELEKSE